MELGQRQHILSRKSYDELVHRVLVNENAHVVFALNDDDDPILNGVGDENWQATYFEEAKDFYSFGTYEMNRRCDNYQDFKETMNVYSSLPDVLFEFPQDDMMKKLCTVKRMSEIVDEKYVYPIKIRGAGQILQGIDPNRSLSIFLSDRIVKDCRDGKCKVLFHELWEGHGENTSQYYNFFTRIAETYDIPKQSIGFADSNLLTPYFGEITGFKGFSVLYFEANLYAKYLRASKEHAEPEILSNKLSRRPKHFVNLNRRTKPHRTIIAAEMFYNHSNKATWSHLDKPERLPKLGKQLSSYINIDYKFKVAMPRILDVDVFTNDIDINHSLQGSAYINILTESIFFGSGDSIFLTEKTFKPILYGQPFIIVGCPYSLRYLRDEGYATFSPYINEEYDEITNNSKRMVAIIEEIRRLSALSEDEMYELNCNLIEVCTHNYQNFLKNGKNRKVMMSLINGLDEWLST